MNPQPPASTLFPYTTLFRSGSICERPSSTNGKGERRQLQDRVPVARRALCPEMLLHHSRSEEHTSELQSRRDIVCRLLLEKKKAVPIRRKPMLIHDTAIPSL